MKLFFEPSSCGSCREESWNSHLWLLLVLVCNFLVTVAQAQNLQLRRVEYPVNPVNGLPVYFDGTNIGEGGNLVSQDSKYAYDGTTVTFENDAVVLTGNLDGSFFEVIREGDPVAGTSSGTFVRAREAFIDASGSKAAVFSVLNLGDAVLSGTPGSLAVERFVGEDASFLFPGTIFNNLQSVLMNSAGEVAYWTQTSDAGSTDFIFLGENPVLQSDVPYAGLPGAGEFSSIDWFGLRLNNDGELLFRANVASISGHGVYHRSVGGQLTEVVRFGLPAVGVPGHTYSGITPYSFADGGWMALYGNVRNASNIEDPDGCLWVGTASALALVMKEGWDVPIESGDTAPFEQWDVAWGGVGIAANGNAVIRGKLDTNSPNVDTNSRDGVWYWDGVSLRFLLRDGRPVLPSEPSRIVDGITRVAISPSGAAVISAEVGSRGVILATDPDGSNLRIVIDTGDQYEINGTPYSIFEATLPDLILPGSTLPNGGDGRVSFVNSDDQVMVRVRMTGAPVSSFTGVLELNVPPPPSTGRITGQVRDDDDADGNFAAPDGPFQPNTGVTLKLFQDDGTGTATPTGNQIGDDVQPETDGYFRFEGVQPGIYVVVAELDPTLESSGYVITAPTESRQVAVVVADQTESGIDFLAGIPTSEITMRLRKIGDISAVSNPGPSGVGIDDPLIPVSEADVLVTQPVIAGGLAADGVSPLLIEMPFPPSNFSETYRWTCELVTPGATIEGGVYSKMYFQSEPEGHWEPAVVPPNGHQNRFTIPASPMSATSLFVYVSNLNPNDINLPEVTLRFRVVENISGDEVGSVDFRIRRPPVFLIPTSPAQPFGGQFLEVLEQERSPDFIRSLSYDIDSLFPESQKRSKEHILWIHPLGPVLDGLGWDTELDKPELSEWAFCRVDVVAHGNGGLIARGLGMEGVADGFRHPSNLNRGRYRRAVTIGTPHASGYSTFQLFQVAIRLRMKKLGTSAVGTAAFLPAAISSVSAWKTKPSQDFLVHFAGSPWVTRSATNAKIHMIGTKINPADAPIFPLLGLDVSLVNELFLHGSDGVIDIDDAVAGAGDESHHATQLSTAHAGYFNSEALFGATGQVRSGDVGEIAALILNGSDQADVIPVSGLPTLVGGGFFNNTLQTAQVQNARRIADGIIRQSDDLLLFTQFTEVLGEAPLNSPQRSFSPLPSANVPSSAETFTFEILSRPEAPISTSPPNFFVEVFGPGGPTTDGVSVVAVPGEPNQISVVVQPEVIGDVVLYASYQSANLGLIFAKPILVTSRAPQGATMTGIELFPPEVLVFQGEGIRPVVRTTYDNGMKLRRWIEVDDIIVTSSSPAVVDVSEKMEWLAVEPGNSTVTVNFEGESAQMEVTVGDAYPELTFQQWKEHHYPAEDLADPLITGDGVDLEGDLVTLRNEYLTGGDPGNPDPGQLPTVIYPETAGDGQPVLRVRVSSQLAGENLVLKRSTNLETWTNFFTFTGLLPDELDPKVLSVEDVGPYYEVLFDIGGDPDDLRAFLKLVGEEE